MSNNNDPIKVSIEDTGQRLDKFVASRTENLSFVAIQKLLRTGQIRIDGKRALGKERIFEMFNEIFRMSGAHDLKLEVDEVDQEQELSNVGNEQFITQLKEQWPQVMEFLQSLLQEKQAQAQQQQGEPGAPPMEGEQQPQTSPEQQVQL